MEIVRGIEILDLCLHFDNTLVIGDVHLGYEEALRNRGLLVPDRMYEQIIMRLKIVCICCPGQ
ncbi:hypothetical protein GF327_00820 [Candidatus Woesearchaeota archaeon]|nr:hypothetical protein [Candidatus Woesearchaeota archaeon]